MNQVFMLTVRVKGQNPHFQAVFADERLSYKAMYRYMKNPAYKRGLMEATVDSYDVHTDLTVLDWIKKEEVKVND